MEPWLLGLFTIFSQSWDISGGSRSPEATLRCTMRRATAAWRWWSCSSRRKLGWLWKTGMAGGLGWEMWWVFDGFCLLLLLCLVNYCNRYYFLAAVLFVERWDFLWSVVSQGVFSWRWLEMRRHSTHLDWHSTTSSRHSLAWNNTSSMRRRLNWWRLTESLLI